MQVIMVPRNHALRPSVERLIADVYAQYYSASIATYPEVLAAMTDSDCRPVCAAALRYPSEGFFSECYLDAPIQTILSDWAKRTLQRDKIFEVTSLASRTPNLAASFLRTIVTKGENDGFEWVFFTAIERLKALLERLRLPLLDLSPADPNRVSDPTVWGTYYEYQPHVYAVNRTEMLACLHSQPGGTVPWLT